MGNFKLAPILFNCKESKEKDKKQSLMLSKSKTETICAIRPTMQCVITTSQTNQDLWEVKFEDKNGKLRIT